MFKKGNKLVGQKLPSDLRVPTAYEKFLQREQGFKYLSIVGLTLDELLQYQNQRILILSTQDIVKLVQKVVQAWFDLFNENWYFESLSLKEILVTVECSVYFSGTPNQTSGIIQEGFHTVMKKFIEQVQAYFEANNTNQEVSSVFKALTTVLPKIKYHWQLQRFNFVIHQYELKPEITHSLGKVDNTNSLGSTRNNTDFEEQSSVQSRDETEATATQFLLPKIAQIEEEASRIASALIVVSELEKQQLINQWVDTVKNEYNSDSNALQKLDAIYNQYAIQNEIQQLVQPRLRNSIQHQK